MEMWGCSLVRLLKSTISSLVLLMFVVAPVSQGVHLFSVSQFIIIGDQTDHRSVIRKFDDDVGAVRGYTVVRVQRVQERAENTALRAPVFRVSEEEMLLPTLTTRRLGIQDPAAQRSVQT